MKYEKQLVQFFVSSLCLFFVNVTTAQQLNYPLNYFSNLYLEDGLAKLDSSYTPAFKATPESWLNLDSVWAFGVKEVYYSVASEKLYYDHLINIKEGDFQASIDLLGKQEVGREFSDTSIYSDTTTFYNNSRDFY